MLRNKGNVEAQGRAGSSGKVILHVERAEVPHCTQGKYSGGVSLLAPGMSDFAALSKMFLLPELTVSLLRGVSERDTEPGSAGTGTEF